MGRHYDVFIAQRKSSALCLNFIWCDCGTSSLQCIFLSFIHKEWNEEKQPGCLLSWVQKQDKFGCFYHYLGQHIHTDKQGITNGGILLLGLPWGAHKNVTSLSWRCDKAIGENALLNYLYLWRINACVLRHINMVLIRCHGLRKNTRKYY